MTSHDINDYNLLAARRPRYIKRKYRGSASGMLFKEMLESAGECMRRLGCVMKSASVTQDKGPIKCE